MPGARTITERLANTTSSAADDAAESGVAALFERLHRQPDELGEFDARTWEVYRGQLSASDDVATASPRALTRPWNRRNVSLEWTPALHEWHLPQKDNSVALEWLTSGDRLRVLGECWGMSAVSHPSAGGRVITTSSHPEANSRVRWSSAAKDAVTCAIGCTFSAIHEFLLQQGNHKALCNQPGYSRLTVMGTLGTGGHGSGLTQGPLESLVRSVTLASLRSEHEVLRFTRNDPEFSRVVHHLGRLGPVLEMELEVRDAFRIAERRVIRVLGEKGRDWHVDLRRLIDEAVALQEQAEVHSAEIWIAPYTRRKGELVAALGVRRYTTDPVSADTKRPATLRYEVLQTAGRALATLLTAGLEHLTPWVLETAVRSTNTPAPVIMDARTGLDFGAPNVNRMGSIEAGVALERGSDALIAVVEKLAQLAQERLYVFSPLGVRFVGAARDGNLSPQSGRLRTLHIEIPTLGNDRLFKGDKVLAPLQRLLANEFDGRPHWGQRVYLSHRELSRLWPRSSLGAMADLVQKLDPKAVFANPLVDGVLQAGLQVRA